MTYSIHSKRLQFLSVQYIYLATTFILIQVEAIEESPWILMLMSLWNIVSYSYLFYQEVKYAPEIHPFTILALICVQYIGINGVTYANRILNGEEIIFCGNIVSNILVLGTWYLSIQHILSYTTYFWILNKKIDKATTPYSTLIFESVIPYRKWGMTLYKYIWGLRIIDLIIGLNSYSSFLWNISNKAQLITLTLLMFCMLQKPDNKKVSRLFWIIVSIEIIRVLGVGSKQGIINNLIPYLLYLLIGYKIKIITLNKKLLVTLGSIGIFVMFVVFPYVSVFRDIAQREKKTWSEVEITAALSEYGDYMLGTGYYSQAQENNKTSSYLADRAGAISCNSWAIDYAQREGSEPKYIIFNAVSLIPRVIWPNKPPNITGNMLYHIAYGDPHWELKSLLEYESGTTQTFVSAGFIGGCYFALGPIAAIFFPLFAGWFIARFWIFLRDKLYYNLIAIWSFYTLIDVILTDFEGFDDCGILFYFFSCFYILLIKYVLPNKKYKSWFLPTTKKT